MSIEFRLEVGAKLPLRGSKEAAGLDIHSLVDRTIHGHRQSTISTGVFLNQLPRGTYIKIEPRSKLANSYGIDILGGVVDADYRGEIMVIVHNTRSSSYSIEKGDAIAQLVVKCIDMSEPVDVTNERTYSSTERGDSGINSKELRG